MDQLLAEVAAAAERGDPVPRLRLSTNTMLVTGQPVSSRRFIELTNGALQRDFAGYFREQDKRLPRKERRDQAALTAESQRYSEHNMSALLAPEQPGGAVCIEGATCWPWAGGDGIQLPAVRIPVSSVDLWWVAGGTTLKAPSQGGSWFVGGIFPTPGN